MKYFIGGAVLFIGFIGFRIGMRYRDTAWKRRVKRNLKKAEWLSKESRAALEAIILENGKEDTTI